MERIEAPASRESSRQQLLPVPTATAPGFDPTGIHKSKATRTALRLMPRIRLHFLPPYCPDENRIERLWLDLHANVTRNHRHSNLAALCADVASYLEYVSPWCHAENVARPPARLTA
jgi:hypothetical protein